MTLPELKELYKSVYYVEEDMIIDVIVATAIATILSSDPVWLLIIGGPSSGKSELVNTLNKIPFVHPVSSMTENTFLSSMRTPDGKEASLLHQIGGRGMITMKDYTSILSMRSEKRDVIVGQMREIYDGAITKKAGNGNSQSWEGKINWIGAVTESIYLAEDESSGMGRRTINYIMPNQDRKATTRQSRRNNSDIGEKRTRIQEAFAEYIMETTENMERDLPDIDDELADELINLADFVTRVRTPTERNFRGELILIPSAEMPMRVFHMFQTLAKVFKHLNNGVITDEHKKILYKLAMDSIPKQKYLTLKILSEHKMVTTKGAAQKLRYPTETMRMWLENVNVLGICERGGGDGSDGNPMAADSWMINEEFRQIMLKYGNIEYKDDILSDKSEMATDNYINPTWAYQATDDPGKKKENEEKLKKMFEDF